MRLVQQRYLIRGGGFEQSGEWLTAVQEITGAITAITWPPGTTAGTFIVHPQSGKRRGEGNGVVPIKVAFLEALTRSGWSTDERRNPDRFDAVKSASGDRYLGAEWETGNISSSHRALDRLIRAWQRGQAWGGFLVLPTRRLAQYLTDRVGNWEELEGYFSVWEAHTWDHGALMVMGVEQDGEDVQVPRITKGTDGRALL